MTYIDDPDLATRIESMTGPELDALPFGVIRLDAAYRVEFFSRTEAALSGYGDRRAVGLSFFTQLAPCLQTPDLENRVRQARERGTLDIMFDHIGDFGDDARHIRVRVVSASRGGFWFCLKRRD